MNPPLPGSGAGAEVGRPQISRLNSVSRSGFWGPPPNARSAGTAELNVSKYLTCWPLNVFGETLRMNSTTSFAYVGDDGCGACCAIWASGFGNCDWFARVIGITFGSSTFRRLTLVP